jgi:alpha-glucosidase (family GH31 glycosyl hydrolase)
MGAMCSNMHDEDACAGGSGPKASIWTSTDARAAWAEYALLHTRLEPYLLALAAAAHTSGAPLIRHLFLEHPDRADLASVDDSYYFGPALLVAPVVKRGATSRTLALPDGAWLDWRDQKLITNTGGGSVTLDAPLAKLPLLLRDGQLVPLLDPSIQTLDEEAHPGVIGPAEVASVYDVVGLVTRATGSARFTLVDGSTLTAQWSGGFAPPALAAASSEADLASCAGCWLRETLDGGLARVRISAPDGDLAAGGLQLSAHTGRRVRWDLYLTE